MAKYLFRDKINVFYLVRKPGYGQYLSIVFVCLKQLGIFRKIRGIFPQDKLLNKCPAIQADKCQANPKQNPALFSPDAKFVFALGF